MKLDSLSNYSTIIVKTTTPISTNYDNESYNIFLICIAMVLISMPFCLLCFVQVYLKLYN